MNTPRYDLTLPDNDLTGEQKEILHRVGWSLHATLREALSISLLEYSKVSGLMNRVREQILSNVTLAMFFSQEPKDETQAILERPFWLLDTRLSSEGVSRLIHEGILSQEMLETLDEAREDVLKQAYAYTMGQYFFQCLELHFRKLSETATSTEDITVMKENGMDKILRGIRSYSLEELQKVKTMEDHIQLLKELLGNFYDYEEELKRKFDKVEMQAVPELLHALIEELTRRKDEDHVHTLAFTKDGELVEVCGDAGAPQDMALAVAALQEGEVSPDEAWLKAELKDEIPEKPFSRFTSAEETFHVSRVPWHIFIELAKKTLPSMEDLYRCGFAQGKIRTRPVALVRGTSKPPPIDPNGLLKFMPPGAVPEKLRNGQVTP